ncbi:DNA sulfur modification protein DndB [Mesorhizobium sp. B1-1-8]|uniref:DNA sulfur modification protein DndB n=1 Tax=Mesorhizobium sp. B1-1-8 TaxID=2589976 RepID=UPI00112B2ADD|nr:DNA sulfur modification protein DndB [Mesorhizobium sp. B1-1-8]UCI08257.1 DNA sulfur modification protein DndB [Mesorhizobium sp. B1-1-8]
MQYMIQFPAMRGQMGTRTYFACLMPLDAIQSLFKFDPEERQWTDLSPEQREQRQLNKARVPALTSYMLENEEDYLFASITASYKSEPVFQAFGDNENIGTLGLKLGDELTINDGQHRCAAIVEAVKKNPELGKQMISVLLFPWENITRVQQMFTDLNRHVVKTSKSLDVLFDKRDPISIATLIALEKVPVFKEYTEKVDASLKAKSTKIFTLAALYDANSDLLKEHASDDIEANAARLAAYWSKVADHMQDWKKVLAGMKSSTDLRSESISAHSTVLRALGGLGSELMKEEDWQDRLSALSQINWSKTNPDWQDVCIVANSVISNRQARAATKAYIKGRLGIELTESEQRSIQGAAKSAA